MNFNILADRKLQTGKTFEETYIMCNDK